MEIFSPPRVTATAERRPFHGVLPAGALDVRPGPEGESWYFDFPEDGERPAALPPDRQPAVR
eukprot:15146275-Alexandrium_andersonii.AAC.1